MAIATFDIRKTKSKVHGRIEADERGGDTPVHYSISFYLGHHHAGFKPVIWEAGAFFAY
jgi:hypothetical protein